MFSCVLGCVFLQRYFGMYLLRGISTLAAPALPRAPLRACAPARVSFSAPLALLVRSGCASLALWLRHVVPVRLCGFPARFCRFPVRFRCLPLFHLFASFASTRYYVCSLLCCCFLLRFCISIGCAHGYASAWLSWRSYFVRRWRYHSCIPLHSASYSFFLTHMHLKLSYINHVFSVYL